MTVPHLPPELIVHIISCIGNYRDSDLRACGLVCHAWVEPARRAMFRTVHLRSLSSGVCAALLELLDRTPAVSGYINEILWDVRHWYKSSSDDLVVHSLLDRISTITIEHGISHRVRIVLKRSGGKGFAGVLDRAPAIGPFVRDVVWFFDDAWRDLWTNSEYGGLDLAGRLRHVRKLALSQTGTFPFEATAPFSRLSKAMASASVTQLSLEHVIFKTMVKYASFISSFSSLKYLYLSNVEIEDKEHLDYRGCVPPSLRSFVLGPTKSKLALLSYLIGNSASRPLGLSYLSATFGPDALGAVGSRLLQACEVTLTTLSLHGLSGAAIDLSSCRALVDLKLEDQFLHSIIAALELVRSENLRSLQIEVNNGKDEDWERLGVVLTGAQFTRLDVLRICYCSKDRQTPLPQVLLQPLRREALIWEEHPGGSKRVIR